MDVYIGFDSAWTDNPKAPGAICAIAIKDRQPLRFYAPQFVSFNQALTFIKSVSADDGVTLIALDQPTVVPNSTGMRPVDRVAASLAGWLGGGVQPANRGRLGMFSSSSPIWCFLNALGATFKDPEQARLATKGLYLMEVFPALALPSLGACPLYASGTARRGAYRLDGKGRNGFRQPRALLGGSWTAAQPESVAEPASVNCGRCRPCSIPPAPFRSPVTGIGGTRAPA